MSAFGAMYSLHENRVYKHGVNAACLCTRPDHHGRLIRTRLDPSRARRHLTSCHSSTLVQHIAHHSLLLVLLHINQAPSSP